MILNPLLTCKFWLFFHPFWNHWWSLQSDWLSAVRFLKESHCFCLPMRKRHWSKTTIRERCLSSRAWNKEKILNPHQESNSDLRILRSDALPLSHRDYGEQDLMIRVLHAAKISNVNSVMFINRIREMVSF